MKIRIDCKFQMEYLMKTYSNLEIQGTGKWDIDQYELAEEFINSDFENFDDFLEDYLYNFNGLDLDSALIITFNENDLEVLRNFVTIYKKNEN